MNKVSIYKYKGEAFTMSNQNNYGCANLILDCVLTIITGGLWLIWIFVREMRNH